MSMTRAKPAPTETRPGCNRCERSMDPSAWMLKPNGHGGLLRVTVYLCRTCGRLFDELWGYREPAPTH